MPSGDGKGPNGLGPMTGRAVGYCAGRNAPRYESFGSGGGMGRGGGRRRNRFRATRGIAWQSEAFAGPARALDALVESAMRGAEIAALKDQAEYFKKILEDIRKRLEEVEALSNES